MKIVTIIGARPQIIKASAISRAIKKHNSLFANGKSKQIEEVLVHTGQHYDENMSGVFFSQMQIPTPKYNLAVGSASHGVQTSLITQGIEEVLLKEKPQAIILYGDTNSTLAGAIAASKIFVPIVHIEAGLRSKDKIMPEEINRVLCDHVSTLLFCPTQAAIDNLKCEGFPLTTHSNPNINQPNVYHCGDIMLDNTLYFSAMAKPVQALKGIDKYILCTIHRNANTDSKDRLTNIFAALLTLAKTNNIILPLHPRTRKMISSLLDLELQGKMNSNENLHIIEPMGYLEMVYLEKHCSLIITDSGGVQKEAYFLQHPCVIMRPETEWVEIVRENCAFIADADTKKIISGANNFLNHPPKDYPSIFGEGKAAEFIIQETVKTLS
jgi:UDP-N-acetylglucosamine 2-epimerase